MKKKKRRRFRFDASELGIKRKGDVDASGGTGPEPAESSAAARPERK